jgi:arginyl-tRNA synthetase
MVFKKEVATIIEKVGLAKELIQPTPNPEMGNFAVPCFSLAKKLKKAPNQIAQDLALKIKPSKNIEKIEANGPYLNFYIKEKILIKDTMDTILSQKEQYGSLNIKEKVVIEYPSPNTNKPLHLGHVRNMILSQSVAKILEFSGNKVISVNLNNDRGVHICKSMLAYNKFGKTDTPEKSKLKPDHFVGKYYVKYAQEVKKDKSLEEEAKEYLRQWEKGDKEIVNLWKQMNTWAYKGWTETYKKFNVKFTKQFYESQLYKEGRDIILNQHKNGVVQKAEDGAYFIDLEKYKLGEKFLLRADGTSIYITQDIFLAQYKEKEFKADRSIIVTAVEQNYHFKVLFKILELFNSKMKNYHLNYGMVNLTSGRMKSREGNVVDADNIVKELEDMAKKELEKRYDSLSQKELEKRSQAIAMASLRFYFLRVGRIKDITFNPKESIAFDGETGPYLLYTYARARSILRKAKYKESKIDIKSITKEEKALIIKLRSFSEDVQKSYNSLSPNIIARFALDIAALFNEFYQNNKVIGSQEESFRLALVDVFSQVLKNSLSLLNIDTIEQM